MEGVLFGWFLGLLEKVLLSVMLSRFCGEGGQPFYMSSMGGGRKQFGANMRHAKSAHVK